MQVGQWVVSARAPEVRHAHRHLLSVIDHLDPDQVLVFGQSACGQETWWQLADKTDPLCHKCHSRSDFALLERTRSNPSDPQRSQVI
jgi:hypothetical protein